MRPLRLTIEGFTAFRERQEINFEGLELFVITGPTGAGKTSILDAMAFALYGEVPRIGGSRGTADVISLGTDRAAVQFEFRVGERGRHRIARRISRRQGQSATLERQEGKDWVAVSISGVTEANQKIQELVGLDFDAFTRAVILPQGEFHRFLKGEAKDRRKVLFSLLGVSYFQRMGALARAKQGDLEAGVKRTEDLLEKHYADANQDHLEQLRVVAETAEAAKASISQALGVAADNAEVAAEAARRITVLEAAEGELQVLETTVLASLDSIREAEAGHEQASAALNRATTGLGDARAATGHAETQLSELISDVGTLEDLAAAAAAARTLGEAADQQRAAERELEAATEAQATAQTELDTATTLEAQAVTKLSEATAAVQAAETEAGVATLAAEELARSRDEATKLAGQLTSAETALADIQAKLAAQRADAVNRREDLVAAVSRWEQHRRLHAVAELAEGLGEGDPCPVCGVALTAAIAVEPDATQALEQARAAEQTARSLTEKQERVVATAEAEVGSAQTRRDECQRRLTDALAGHAGLAALSAVASQAAEAGNARVADARRLAGVRTALDGTRETARAAVINAQLAMTQRDSAVEASQKSIAEIRQRRSAAQALLAERFGASAPEDAPERLAADRLTVVQASEAVERARSEQEELTDQHDVAAKRLAAAKRQLTEIDLELTRVVTKSGALASQISAPPGAVDLGRSPDLNANREQCAEQIAGWCADAASALLQTAQTTAVERDEASAQVIRQAKDQEIEAPDAEQALVLLKHAEQNAIKRSTEAHAAVGECERKLAARQQMEEEVKEDRQRIAVLASLGQELQNNRFGDYIIEETLGLLSDRASTELKQISGGRYSLRPAKGEFQVIDHANADERRSVKTLSGGETFLASLALALALSRHLGELASEGMGAKLESVFIDEGFGTLDPATLDEVIDALERLRAEELIVGVISHVPELAQRIQSGLEVHQDGGRSRITVVGPE
ncbi:MAG: AAA family ATPase [Solirubrobacteraceae bacterium]